MNQKSNRRTNLVVDAGTQGAMMVRWISIPIAVLVVGAAMMLWVASATFAELRDLGGDAPPMIGLVAATAAFALGISGMLIWIALQQSHRIAGPTRRLEASIQRIRSGDLDFRVTLRDGDELTSLARELNELIDVLQEKERVDVEDDAAETAETPATAHA